MASLMESYEQQYSSLTNEIVAKNMRIPNLSGTEKLSTISCVEKLLGDARELLEQMELEARESRDRQKYQARIKTYELELKKLEKDLKRARIAFSDELNTRDELFGDDDYRQSEDQRARLLDNTDRLERSSKKLEHGYRTCLESEEIGAQALQDLHSQRETIKRSRDRLREVNEGLGKSSRILSGMLRRVIEHRVILVVLTILLVLIIGIAMYFAIRR